MTYINEFERRLSGGHPNSLGDTIKVVDEVIADKAKLAPLFACYKSQDQVVRLRVSNAIKRITKEKPSWVAEYLDQLLGEVSKIDQASTKWTLSTLFMLLEDYMSKQQTAEAVKIMQNNLHYNDWIVQNSTAESLTFFARSDNKLKMWLIPELKKLTKSRYKSVRKRAEKNISELAE